MTKWGRRLFSIAFSFMFLFISVGYAQLADTLVINGTATYHKDAPTDIAVIAVSPYGNNNTAGGVGAGFIYSTTNVEADVKGVTGQSVTYEITVKNYNSSVDYAFNAVKCKDATMTSGNKYFGNGLTVTVKTAEGKDAKGALVKSGETLKLYATYTIGSAAPQNQTIETLLHYEFAIGIDSLGGYVPEATLAQFAEILNSKDTYTVEELKKWFPNDNIANPMTKKEVLDKIMSTQGGGWLGTGHYVGNVAGSEDTHSTVLGALFSEGLSLQVYNPATQKIEDTEMTCLIKEADVTNDDADDMTLYLTAETLDGKCNTSGLLTGAYENRYVVVYAVVFTKIGTEWVQLGDIYSGQANPNNYSGGGRNSDANSFRTDSWVSTNKAYTVVEALTGKSGTTYANMYSYTVNSNQKISAIMTARSAEANAVFVDLLETADIILNYPNLSDDSKEPLTTFKTKITTLFGNEITYSNGTYTIANSVTRVRLEPYMKELRALLNPFTGLL